MLEHITSVAPIVAAKSMDWEPCKKCGERLEFTTNGMGVLLPACPVCDWGFKPSRDYAAFQERAEAIQPVEQPHTGRYHYRPRACLTCGADFSPTSSSQKYCDLDCRPSLDAAAWRAQRERWRAEGKCGLCGGVRDRARRRTCSRCLERASQAYTRRHKLRGYWQNKTLRGAA